MTATQAEYTYQDAIDVLRAGHVKINANHQPGNRDRDGRWLGARGEEKWEYIIPAEVSPENAAHARAVAGAFFGIEIPDDSRKFVARPIAAMEVSYLAAVGQGSALEGAFIKPTALGR